MLTIDRLRLHLPCAFEDQAGEIARLIGQELRDLPTESSMRVDRLALPPVEAPAGAGSPEVARAVAAAMGAGLRARSQT